MFGQANVLGIPHSVRNDMPTCPIAYSKLCAGAIETNSHAYFAAGQGEAAANSVKRLIAKRAKIQGNRGRKNCFEEGCA
jgi:hypothetical protein